MAKKRRKLSPELEKNISLAKKQIELITEIIHDIHEEEKQEQYLKIGKERCLAMIAKATEKDSDYIGISKEQWVKLPSTLKYKVQNTLMGVQISDFQSG